MAGVDFLLHLVKILGYPHEPRVAGVSVGALACFCLEDRERLVLQINIKLWLKITYLNFAGYFAALYELVAVFGLLL